MQSLEALQKFFGFSAFREGQKEIVDAILAGHDTLAIMPTGGGKSLCYQLPALLRPELTLVVSPLIALMKDQVDALRARDLPAGFLNSTMGPSEQRRCLEAVEAGEIRLLYVAPERFRQESFLRLLERQKVGLFAVDEAHCISQWGHDFRPDYFKLGRVLDQIKRPQVLALTATATPAVREDILRILKLREPRVFLAGFSRPNLSLRVAQLHTENEKYARLQSLVEQQKTGIIYCATRKKVEAVAAELADWGVKHVAYHAGMDEAHRTKAQEKFINRQADVVVATNAFGMGIDRADLRFVAHFEIPGSIEAYYQEVGRAGRDGQPSVCELLFLHPDVRVQEFFLEGSNPSPEIIRQLWTTLVKKANREQEVQLTIQELATLVPAAKNEMAISSALSILVRAGCIERLDTPGTNARRTRVLQPALSPAALPVDWAALEEKERLDRERLRQMVDFAYSHECRQQFILRAFGEPHPPRCGVCDRCRGRKGTALRAPTKGETIVVQKLLSCVARMSRRQNGRLVGRFGRQRIIQVLLGSRASALQDLGLDRLSTFGILSDWEEPQLQRLLRECLDAGLLQVEPGEYPLISLTAHGESAMRGSEDYELNWEAITNPAPARASSRHPASTRPKKPKAPPPATQADPPLLRSLKAKRLEMARAASVPAYVIATDAILHELVRRGCTTPAEAVQIRGVSPAKAEGLLLPLLQIVRQSQNLPKKSPQFPQ